MIDASSYAVKFNDRTEIAFYFFTLDNNMETNTDSTPGNPSYYEIQVTASNTNGDTSTHSIHFEVYADCSVENTTVPGTFSLTEDTYTIYAAE